MVIDTGRDIETQLNQLGAGGCRVLGVTTLAHAPPPEPASPRIGARNSGTSSRCITGSVEALLSSLFASDQRARRSMPPGPCLLRSRTPSRTE
jgi:hypothetical protein